MLVVCAMGLAGCGPTWQQRLARTASVQHNCPITRVRVLTTDGNLATYAVDVCNERRVYQRAGSVYVDQTPMPMVQANSSSAAPAQPAQDGAFHRFVRTRMDWYQTQILACTGGPAAIVAEWIEGPVRISVHGQSDAAVAQCVASAIGTIDVPAGTPPGRLIHPIAP